MKIATVGDNCIDVYESLNVCFPGGNPVNVAVYFKRLGGEASYTGVVGDDTYGSIILEALKSKNIDISHVRIISGNTAITKVELIDGERVFGDYNEGVLAQFSLSDSDIDFLTSHDMVVSSLWGNIESELYKIKEKSIPIAFDFANKLSGRILETAISCVDYAFFSYDEGDNEFIREFMKKIKERGPKIVIVTLGDKGSICYDGNEFISHGTVPCIVVDTMGAGDSYIAGFLRGILLGKEIRECMKLGAENAAVTLQYRGTWH